MTEKITFNLGDQSDPISEKLGNFSTSRFSLDDVECFSVEGFIQSLKFSDSEKQQAVAKLVGKEAKFKGKKAGKRIAREGTVFWNGRTIKFRSPEHLALIERGILAKFEQDEKAQQALLATGNAELIHNTGRAESPFTSLPSEHFIKIVKKIRSGLQRG